MLNAEARTPDPPRKFDPFRPLSSEDRERGRSAYLEYLRERDGEIRFSERVLARREERQRQVEASPLRWEGDLDRDAFYQHFHRVGRPEVDVRTLWVVAVAISNEGERFGAEAEMRRFDRMGPQRADPVKLYHVLQENYHTRLLVEACRCLGLDGLTLMKPKPLHRAIIYAMTWLPDSLRYVLIMCGEIVGAVVFRLLCDACRFFPESPEVEERLRALLDEVAREEALHVAYCRTQLGPRGLRAARRLMPLVTRFVMRELPQLHALGFDRKQLARLLRSGVEIPPDVDWIEPSPPLPA